MGAPKQKWTPEEEAALRAGVEKYGPGKWRAIQKDPKVGPSLVSRSNVDLKDKWRNMNVGSGGHGSREKSVKTPRLTMGDATDEPIAALPLASMPGDYLADDTHGSADALVFFSDSTKDRKSLGPRYEHLISEAVIEMKDPNGSNAGAIANYIEEHHPVPSNFRRLLSSKLRDLTMQGKLMKSRQNYKVGDAEHLQSKVETPPQQENENIRQTPRVSRDVSKKMRGNMKAPGLESPIDMPVQDSDDGKATPRFPAELLKKPTGENSLKKTAMDVDLTRTKVKTAAEAARAAALAVAEAEAAAAAAEQAAREAEAAEAEAEAAEIAAEIAALAARPPKKARAVAFATEEVAVTV